MKIELLDQKDLTRLMTVLIEGNQTKLALKLYVAEIHRSVLAIRRRRLNRSIDKAMYKHRDLMFDIDHFLLVKLDQMDD